MIKYFRYYNANINIYEVVTVNLETGYFSKFFYSIHNHNNSEYLLKWGIYETNTSAMGYTNPKDYLKRAKELRYTEFNITELDQIALWNPALLVA